LPATPLPITKAGDRASEPISMDRTPLTDVSVREFRESSAFAEARMDVASSSELVAHTSLEFAI